jgi:hypothetical protein
MYDSADMRMRLRWEKQENQFWLGNLLESSPFQDKFWQESNIKNEIKETEIANSKFWHMILQ